MSLSLVYARWRRFPRLGGDLRCAQHGSFEACRIVFDDHQFASHLAPRRFPAEALWCQLQNDTTLIFRSLPSPWKHIYAHSMLTSSQISDFLVDVSLPLDV